MAFNINKVVKVDPTRTLTLRSNFVTAMKGKFSQLNRAIRKRIVDDDLFKLSSILRQNEDITYAVAEEGAYEFSEWLDEILLAILLTPRAIWSEEYIREAYQRGILHGRYELNRAQVTSPPVAITIAAILGAMQSALHTDKLNYVQSRFSDGMTNILTSLKSEMNMVVKQGIMEGISANILADRLLATSTSITARRAIVLARTEIVAAHHAANIAEYRSWGVNNVLILAEWLTAGDGHVCSRCNAIAQKDVGNGSGIYTISQIEFMIPVHPQCRCMAIPYRK